MLDIVEASTSFVSGYRMTSQFPIVVYVPNKLGGVRSVTESLSRGIEDSGRSVIRAHGIGDVLRARSSSGARSAILSLQAGYCAFLFKSSVYVLHGFPRVDSYSLIRRMGVNLAVRAARLGGARLVAVSYLTRAVYERLYGLPVDAVVFNGCSDSLHERASRHDAFESKRKFVTYVGRLIDGKGLRAIVVGFLTSSLSSAGYTLKIAGAGPLAGWLQELATAHPCLELLGEVPEQVKEDLLFDSEVFVSLNDFEPMGVVFVEAMLAGCKLVAPFCGGHREFVPSDYPVALCDPADARSVAEAFDAVARKPWREVRTSWPAFRYRDHIAPRYLTLLDGLSPPKNDPADLSTARGDEVPARGTDPGGAAH